MEALDQIKDLDDFINDDDWGDDYDAITSGENNSTVPKAEAHTHTDTPQAQKYAPAQKYTPAQKSKKAECVCCSREMKIMSRGLCSACYSKHRAAGTLDEVALPAKPKGEHLKKRGKSKSEKHMSTKESRVGTAHQKDCFAKNSKNRETKTKKESDSTTPTRSTSQSTTQRTHPASSVSRSPNTWASTSATPSNTSGAPTSSTTAPSKTSKKRSGTSNAKSNGENSMKNKLADLNNHLFMQLERLNDETLSSEDLEAEVNRTKAVTAVSNQIISVGKLALDAQKAVAEGHIRTAPKMLGVENEEME
jgi:hypothetical protein